jgi:hypothetical protein
VSTTFGVTRDLDAALRHGFSSAGVRVAPGTQMSTVVAGFNALGISCEVKDGILSLSQDGREFNTSLALRSFSSKPEHSGLFITDASNPRDWDSAQKQKFIREHGFEEWQRKISQPVARPEVRPLDPNMSYEDYENLSRAEKVAFIAEYSDAAVRRIYARRKPKTTKPTEKNRFASNRIEDYA